MPLAMVAFTMVMLVFKEEMLVRAVSGKRNGGNAQPGEWISEAVKSAEGAAVSPRLAVQRLELELEQLDGF
jgi:hypothetical protein